MESLLTACTSSRPHILSASPIAVQSEDLVDSVRSSSTMSSTNHSVPQSTSVKSFHAQTFSNFLLATNSASTAKQSPLVDAGNFSCMSTSHYDKQQTQPRATYTENNNLTNLPCCTEGLENTSTSILIANQNPPEQSTNRESSSGNSNPNYSLNAAVNASLTIEGRDEISRGDVDEEQREEDLRYLGPGGYSLWRGEPCEGGWVRKLGYAERFMTGSADFGVMSTVYNLWFESKVEVDIEAIRKTCYLVAKKLPHLRLFVGRRDGELWFREIQDLKLNVEELETPDLMHSFETLLKKRFDIENGPLWFVRYVKIDNNDTTNTTVTNPEAKTRFVCIFGFHHNFTDGTTNMKFCNVFLNVFNDVLLGRETDLKVEAKLAEAFHDRIADKMRNENLFTNNMWLIYYFCKRFYKGIIAYGHYIRNYTDHYQQPAEHEATTRIIPGELDEETTKKLLSRCKEEKTTLNSAFTAAANIALYKMVLDCDNTVESTHFGGIQTINMRRYWTKEQSDDSCGCHISTLDIQVPTEKKDITDFWNYSHRVQSLMDEELNVTKRGIRMMPIGERLRLILYTNSFLEWAGYPSTNDNHFCVTNMGNLSRIFSGTGEVVEVTKLLRSVSCHYMPNLCQHTLHTFRGKLCYSLDYYTQKMEREHAKLYAKTLLETLKEVVDLPTNSRL